MQVDFKTGTFYLGDCFDVMATPEDGSVDMVLNDPPYGTTQNKWDAVIPFEPMWAAYWRLLKPKGAAVLTAAQPFTSALGASQIDNLRYSWVWNKSHAANPLNAKKRPMNRHEDILVFCRTGLPDYFPQMVECEPFKSRTGKKREKAYSISGHYGRRATQELETKTERYPTSDLYFGKGARAQSLHPTQKPVALFEYLIRTYTNPGELVLDNTAGSGTTAIAAMQSGRRWICIERDPEYFAKAIARVYDAEAAL